MPVLPDPGVSALEERGLDFKPHLKKAPERLDGLLTPEGDPIPANTLAEIRRAMDRLVLVREQIKEIEDTRAEKIAQETPAWHHAMVGKLATIHGLGVDTADMLVSEVFYRDIPNRQALARYGGLTGTIKRTRRGCPDLAVIACSKTALVYN